MSLPDPTDSREPSLTLWDDEYADWRSLAWLHPPQVRCPGCAIGGPMEASRVTPGGQFWGLWCEHCKVLWVAES